MNWNDMPKLTPKQTDVLTQAIAKHCVWDDLERALDRYPGKNDRGSVQLVGDKVTNIAQAKSCLDAVDQENYVQPFLSRVVEQTWQKEQFRTIVLHEVRGIIRLGLDTSVKLVALKEGLEIVLSVLQKYPSKGKIGDPAVFDLVGNSRREIVEFVESLGGCCALKDVHDSLHALQIHGSPWLDEPEAALRPKTRPLQLILAKCLTALDDSRAAKLSMEALEILKESYAQVTNLAAALGAPAIDAHQQTFSDLRSLLIERQPQIDAQMFAICRDLPFKKLQALLDAAAKAGGPRQAALSTASDAAGLLGEELRSRMIEHALWQSVDDRFYALEAFFASETPVSIESIQQYWSSCNRALSLLLDNAGESTSPFGIFRAAYLLYSESMPSDGLTGFPSGDAMALFADLGMAFIELKDEVRFRFFEADQKLMSICHEMKELQQHFEELLRRVPALWEDLK